MHLFVDISSHGLGHLAISAPVLNRLAETVPELRLTVRSGIPAERLRERIAAPFELIAAASDFGYAMVDATRINRSLSATAYRAAHIDWAARVDSEAAFLRRLRPDLVLSNVSYLPLAGAAAAGIRAVALCSLNWADLFAHFFGSETWAKPIHADILAAYRSATAFLRVTPGMAMPALDNVHAIGPVAALGRRHDLGLGGDRAVLIAMGGIAHRLPVDNWPHLPGIRWLVNPDWQCTHPDAVAFDRFGLSFTDLLCSVDAVITKPGYGTFTEAACNGTPVLYQRRDDWPEQDCLIEWLEQQAKCLEISAESLETGKIGENIKTLWAKPQPPRPVANGTLQASARIAAIINALPGG
ncbi:MAG: hypothetical protein ACM3X0_16005 [Bacteroidota bacterium]